jgi:hypothetical protein
MHQNNIIFYFFKIIFNISTSKWFENIKKILIIFLKVFLKHQNNHIYKRHVFNHFLLFDFAKISFLWSCFVFNPMFFFSWNFLLYDPDFKLLTFYFFHSVEYLIYLNYKMSDDLLSLHNYNWLENCKNLFLTQAYWKPRWISLSF